MIVYHPLFYDNDFTAMALGWT